MIDVRVHGNFPLNCIKLIIVVWPAWCPVFCLQVLGMAELLEALEDNLLSSPLLSSALPSWSVRDGQNFLSSSAAILLPALALSGH